MTGKWDALIAEVDRSALYWQDCGVSDDAALMHRVATALREAQAHVPPEGWRVTEISRENEAGEVIGWVAKSQWHKKGPWHIWRRPKRGTGWMTERKSYPTAAAAMAAIEEIWK